VYDVIYRPDTIKEFEGAFIEIIQKDAIMSNLDAAETNVAGKGNDLPSPPDVKPEDIWKWIHIPTNNVSSRLPWPHMQSKTSTDKHMVIDDMGKGMLFPETEHLPRAHC
jgi:hypothetical protein